MRALPVAFHDPFGLLDSIYYADPQAEQLFKSAVRVYRNVQDLDRTKARIINDFLRLVDVVDTSSTQNLLVRTGPVEGGVGSFDSNHLSLIREDGAMDLYHGNLRAIDKDVVTSTLIQTFLTFFVV